MSVSRLPARSKGMDYDAALQFYERTFRSHMDTIILLPLLLVFAGLFYVYLRWLTRYFENIRRGMDTLFRDAPGEISLPPELLPIERKMNLVKLTIDWQKSDMLLAEQRKNDLHGGIISREKLERIFEQFYRLDTGRGFSGAGLGLANAKQIITLHKGAIAAESEGGVAVFTVALPTVRWRDWRKRKWTCKPFGQ